VRHVQNVNVHLCLKTSVAKGALVALMVYRQHVAQEKSIETAVRVGDV